jgi:RNA-binding protein YhbY
VSVKHEVLQTPSTIRSLTYDEKGRLIGIFKIDYGTAQGKKRYELFEKIASPWIPVDSTTPRAGYMDSYFTDGEVGGLLGSEFESLSTISAVAKGVPAEKVEVNRSREAYRDYQETTTTAYFVPRLMKDEKLRNSIVKKLDAAGFQKVNSKVYGIAYHSTSHRIQQLTQTEGIPKEAINMEDLSKVQYVDKVNKDHFPTTSYRQQIDKNKKEKKQQSQQAQNENKKMKIAKQELANIIKEEVEKALKEREIPDEKVLDFIKTNSAKEIWKSLGEEEKAKISNIAQKASDELYNSGFPEWAVPFILKDAFAAALEQTKGSVEIFAKSLRDQIKIARTN